MFEQLSNPFFVDVEQHKEAVSNNTHDVMTQRFYVSTLGSHWSIGLMAYCSSINMFEVYGPLREILQRLGLKVEV